MGQGAGDQPGQCHWGSLSQCGGHCAVETWSKNGCVTLAVSGKYHYGVFVTAATKLVQLQDPNRLRAWLYAIARHELADLIARSSNLHTDMAWTAPSWPTRSPTPPTDGTHRAGGARHRRDQSVGARRSRDDLGAGHHRVERAVAQCDF